MRSAWIPSSVMIMAAMMAFGAYETADARVIGQVKNLSGSVSIVRGSETIAAVAGAPLEEKDTVRTGADGSVGILFTDDTMMSAGPNSELALARFRPDEAAEPQFETDLKKGTLSVISGKIAEKSPNGMRVTTPRSILGVRGTYFLVKAED